MREAAGVAALFRVGESGRTETRRAFKSLGARLYTSRVVVSNQIDR